MRGLTRAIRILPGRKNLFLTYLYRGRLREYRKDNDMITMDNLREFSAVKVVFIQIF
jgi:hypothetical protein